MRVDSVGCRRNRNCSERKMAEWPALLAASRCGSSDGVWFPLPRCVSLDRRLTSFEGDPYRLRLGFAPVNEDM